jgi:hypothetical protein
VSISPAVAAGGATATVTAILVAPTGTVPTGQVTASVLGTGNTYIASLPGTANTSTLTLTIPVTAPTSAGVYSVVVSCAGTNFTCTPVTVSLTSSGTSALAGIATSTSLALSAPVLPVNGAETLTATVVPASAATAKPIGTVMFYDGATLLGSGVLSTSGSTYTAAVPVVLTATTTHSLTAVYSGDANYATSSSAATIVGSVNATGANAPTISLASSATSALAGTAITLTATVSGSTVTGLGPTGIVSFYVAGPTPSLIGTAALGTAGAGLSLATLTTSGLSAGSVSIYAVYAGDTNFSTATSNSLTLGLNSFNVTFLPQSLTLSAGQTGQSTLILGIINGFSGTVNFGCTPPPNQLMTCTFSQKTLVGGGNTTLTINSTAPKASVEQHASVGLLGIVSLAALLSWALPYRGNRRIPTLLLALLGAALLMSAGCSSGTVIGQSGNGTPLGTSNVTVTAAGSDGVHTVEQTYNYQVTVQ